MWELYVHTVTLHVGMCTRKQAHCCHHGCDYALTWTISLHVAALIVYMAHTMF